MATELPRLALLALNGACGRRANFHNNRRIAAKERLDFSKGFSPREYDVKLLGAGM